MALPSEMRIFAYRSKRMLLIVMALHEIGDENITELQMNIIKGHLKNVPTGDFQKTFCWLQHGFVKNATSMNYQDIEKLASLKESNKLSLRNRQVN